MVMSVAQRRLLLRGEEKKRYESLRVASANQRSKNFIQKLSLRKSRKEVSF